MKPWEHYIEAERILEEEPANNASHEAARMARAQVHATLALVREPGIEDTLPYIDVSKNRSVTIDVEKLDRIYLKEKPHE